MLSEGSKNELLLWNPETSPVEEQRIQDIFAQQVVARPQAQAINAWDGNFTYKELDDFSTSLSIHLITLGVNSEVMVPLCFEKSAWAIVATLAILKAGGACVPLNAGHPASRLEQVIEATTATIVVTSPSSKAVFDNIKHKANLLVVSASLLETLKTSSGLEPPKLVQPNNAAFIIYTSGSTGTPKGVIQEHRAVCASVQKQGKVLGYDETSRILQFAAYTFDVSIGDIFGALFFGGCVCVLSEEDRTSNVTGAINDLQANQACLTPTVARTLRSDDVPTLKTLTLGGEPLTPRDIAMWTDRVELINIYGVTETTVWCTCSHVWSGDMPNPKNIGKAFSGQTWIVDAVNPDKLALLGTIGELYIDGLTLARGYLNDTEQTSLAFIENPKWLLEIATRRTDDIPKIHRVYRTGDLARYNEDGTIEYVGRKDTQVKFHGQRIELGEIEHHLMSESAIKSSMVLLPQVGWCSDRLVAILVLKNLEGKAPGNGRIQLLDAKLLNEAKSDLSSIRETLLSKLPLYMVPSTWVILETSPLNTSGKIDRASVQRWIERIDEQTFQAIMLSSEEEEPCAPTTALEFYFQEIIKGVVHLPADQIGMNRSFMSLGGDSVTAMQIVSRARSIGIVIRVQDVLQSKTIADLALLAEANGSLPPSVEDQRDVDFDLSVAQKFYIHVVGPPSALPVRSRLSSAGSQVTTQDISRAVSRLVDYHPMLLARFNRINSERGSQWSQRLLSNSTGNYYMKHHTLSMLRDIASITALTEAVIKSDEGPNFGLDFFEIEDGKRLINLTAHHLAVDNESWQIVCRDFETILQAGTPPSKKPSSFQAWTMYEASIVQETSLQEVDQITVEQADYKYWNMEDKENISSEVKSQSFSITEEATSRLLNDCNIALRTEPIEIMVSTLLSTFNETFCDRNTSTVFVESQDREKTSSSTDFQNCVGWFTTLTPLQLPQLTTKDLLRPLKHIKDTRRDIINGGWSKFATRILKKSLSFTNQKSSAELLFRYLTEPLPSNCDNFQETKVSVTHSNNDKSLRPALFEIVVQILNGKANFNVSYNMHMGHQEKISEWITAWQQSVYTIVNELAVMNPERTLSDYPLLSLTYSGLDLFKKERFSQLGITSFDQIEDMYPCTPMQQGILISQSRVPGAYDLKFLFNVVSTQNGGKVDVGRLISAWQAVVNRHSMLRTVFIHSVASNGLLDQVVLNEVVVKTPRHLAEESKVVEVLNNELHLEYREGRIPYQLSICETPSGNVSCMLNINHAIIDGASSMIVLGDLVMAYEGKLPASRAPRYRDYVKHLQDKPMEVSKSYWKEYLQGLDPCYFPTLHSGDSTEGTLGSVDVELNLAPGVLRAFCDKNLVTMANVIQTVWGLVLRLYTGSDQICYGYLASGRDIPLDGIEQMVGPLINMLVARMDISGGINIKEIVKQVQTDYLAALDHQHCSLADIQHSLKLAGKPLFNTLMSIKRYTSGPTDIDPPSIVFQPIGGHDPTEVCLQMFSSGYSD